MNKRFVLPIFTLALAFAATSVSAGTPYRVKPSSSLQYTTSFGNTNGTTFGNASQIGSHGAVFTSSTSGGMVFNQSNASKISSGNGGSAWSKSKQDLNGGSAANFTMDLGSKQSGNIDVSSGHNFDAGIGNLSSVQSNRNFSLGAAAVIQSGSGRQSFNGSGITTGSGTISMGGQSIQEFTGAASANSAAGARNFTAQGNANLGSTSQLSVGMNMTTNGPGSASGTFGSSQTSTVTQVLNYGGFTACGRH